MKSWQFGLLIGHMQLILAHLADGHTAIAFALMALFTIVPSAIICAAEARR